MDELHSPYYMHEFVKKVIEIAMDGNARRQELAVSLLAEACKREVVPHHQLILGIRRVKKGLPELLLDVPHASTLLQEIVSKRVEKNCLLEEEL